MKYQAAVKWLLDAAAIPFLTEGEHPIAGQGLFTVDAMTEKERGHPAPSAIGWEPAATATLIVLPGNCPAEGDFIWIQGECWRVSSGLPKQGYIRLRLEKVPEKKKEDKPWMQYVG